MATVVKIQNVCHFGQWLIINRLAVLFVLKKIPAIKLGEVKKHLCALKYANTIKKK